MQHVRTVFLGLAVTAALAAGGQTLRSEADADEARLLSLDTLRIPAEGCITGSFAKANQVLLSTNMLERLQEAYAALLPSGEVPEFKVVSAGEGRYFYVNKEGERCDIRELWRCTDTNTFLRCSFYVAGVRFFGRFESLITVTVMRLPSAPTEVLRYQADVRVWPHGAVVRVFLRHMPGVERYFRKKTVEMRRIFSAVFARLAGPEEGACAPTVLFLDRPPG